MLIDKNIKQVMLGNVEIKRIMSGGGILWQKEIWHQINNPVDDYGDGFIFLKTEIFNKYSPFKTINIRFSPAFISIYGIQSFNINGVNQENKRIKKSIENNGTIITVTFDSAIARISHAYIEVKNQSMPTNDVINYLNDLINASIRIVE